MGQHLPWGRGFLLDSLGRSFPGDGRHEIGRFYSCILPGVLDDSPDDGRSSMRIKSLAVTCFVCLSCADGLMAASGGAGLLPPDTESWYNQTPAFLTRLRTCEAQVSLWTGFGLSGRLVRNAGWAVASPKQRVGDSLWKDKRFLLARCLSQSCCQP